MGGIAVLGRQVQPERGGAPEEAQVLPLIEQNRLAISRRRPNDDYAWCGFELFQQAHPLNDLDPLPSHVLGFLLLTTRRENYPELTEPFLSNGRQVEASPGKDATDRPLAAFIAKRKVGYRFGLTGSCPRITIWRGRGVGEQVQPP